MAQYIRKLSKGYRWYFKFDYNGERFFSPCIYHNQKEARLAESEKYQLLDELRRNPKSKNDLLLKELIKERLAELKTKKGAKYHLYNQTQFDTLLEGIGNVPVSQISKADINTVLLNYANGQHEKGFDNYAVNSMLRSYKALFYFGIDNHNLNIANPCKGIKMFSVKKKLKFIPSDSEIEAVRSLCNPEQKLLIDFAMETGCRIGEALRLKGKDIFKDSIVLYTRKSKNSDLTPRKLPRPVCLTGKYKAEEKIFGEWSDLPKFLDKKLRALKKKDDSVVIWGWHSYRHRFASRLSKQGVPLYEIMLKLGHSSLTTTQRYLQLIQ